MNNLSQYLTAFNKHLFSVAFLKYRSLRGLNSDHFFFLVFQIRSRNLIQQTGSLLSQGRLLKYFLKWKYKQKNKLTIEKTGLIESTVMIKKQKFGTPD
jgi:hypothetical protein